MSSPLETATAQAITKVISWIERGGDIVAAQAPDIARQYLAWVWLAAMIGMVGAVCLLLAALGAGIYIRWVFVSEEAIRHDGHAVGVVLGFVGGIACGLVGGIQLCESVGTLVKLHVAPKIVLLEGLRNLIR